MSGLLQDAMSDYGGRFASGLSLPEYRPIELSSKKRRMTFASRGPEDGVSTALPESLALNAAFMLLDTLRDAADPAFEHKTSWEKYRSFPEIGPARKIIAEVYRILRVVRLSSICRTGYVEPRDGMVKIGCVHEDNSIAMVITRAGLSLLRSMVAYYCNSFNEPYSPLYVETIIHEYYDDLIREIKWFNDENKTPYQFRKKLNFNRYIRFDCDNPKFNLKDEGYEFDVGEYYRDSWRYPINFFIVINDILHIVPVETLTDFTLPLADLDAWRARTADGLSLPDHFRLRFGHEIVVPS